MNRFRMGAGIFKRKGTMMKHKETVDDAAIKDASKMQRNAEKVDLIEGEDPEGFAKQKELKKKALGKSKNTRKKAAREDREKTEKIAKAVTKMRAKGLRKEF